MATRKARFVPSNLFTYRAEMRSPVKYVYPGFWLQLLQTHPFRVLISVWAITTIAGLIAIAGLINPGDITQTPQAPTPEPTRVADSEVEEPHRVPLWSLGILISSCAVGCIVVSQLLNRKPAPGRKALSPQAQLARRSLQGQAAMRSRRLGPGKAKPDSTPKTRKIKRLKPYRESDAWLLPPLNPSQRLSQGQFLPSSRKSSPKGAIAKTGPKLHPAIAKATPKPQPAITVVPPEEAHPLDWGEESLAHAMDLRKQQPLSSLL